MRAIRCRTHLLRCEQFPANPCASTVDRPGHAIRGGCVSYLVWRQESLLRCAFQCEHSCCQRTQNASAVCAGHVFGAHLAQPPCLPRYSGTYRNDFHAVSRARNSVRQRCSNSILGVLFFVGLWCKVSTTCLCNA